MRTLALASVVALAGFLIEKLVTHSEAVCSSIRRPRSRARRMARVRLLTPNFERIWLTCSFTVPGATTNAIAISRLEAPTATNCSTSSSRSLSGSSNGCVRTSGLVFLAQAFEMPGQAWGKQRSPVLPSEFFPQPTFRQRSACPGDLALARCGVRD